MEIDEEPEEELPWFYHIEAYLQNRTYLELVIPDQRRFLHRMANKYIIVESMLFRRGFNGELLRCLTYDEAYKVIGEAHSDACGVHMNGTMLAKKILRQGYYWPTMEEDCVKFVCHCEKCQLHADRIHAPASSLHLLSSTWPFSMWAFDVVGPLSETGTEAPK